MNKVFSTALPADNVVLITRLLLRRLQVKVTDTTIRDTILSHPNHPSLLSIVDCLQKWGVRATAIRVTGRASEVPCPFIAHTNQSFVIVEKIEGGNVTYTNERNISETVAAKIFNWDGIALLAERNENSGEVDYSSSRRKEHWKNHRLLYGFVVLLVAAMFNGINAFLICNAAGMLVTCMLLWYEYDSSNAFLKGVCSLTGSGNCNEVLSSKGAKIGGVSLSEVGFVYFTGAFIFQSVNADAVSLLSSVSLIAAPFILYSIFYQGFIVKKWCALCLIVQALLLTEAVMAVFMNRFSTAVSPQFFIAYFIPAFAWFVAKPYIYEAKEKKTLGYRLAKMKNNAGVFYRVLQSQRPMNALKRSAGILLGNPDAPNHLVKVCNPYCIPCAKTHPKIDRLLETGNWKVQIIFTAGDSPHENNAFAAAYLLNKATGTDCRQMLHRWYSTDRLNANLFVSREAAMQSLQQQKEQLKYMYDWCSNENITHTPTIYVNGYRLPEEYDITDLEFLQEQ